MSSLVLFPPLSKETPDTEGVLATWFVSEGSSVVADQLLAEVQVDKVAAEVPAPVAGVVHLLVAEEAVVRQGAPIARIDWSDTRIDSSALGGIGLAILMALQASPAQSPAQCPAHLTAKRAVARGHQLALSQDAGMPAVAGDLLVAAALRHLLPGTVRATPLFLVSPIPFRGRLVRYVGRVRRAHPGKETAEVQDRRRHVAVPKVGDDRGPSGPGIAGPR